MILLLLPSRLVSFHIFDVREIVQNASGHGHRRKSLFERVAGRIMLALGCEAMAPLSC